MAAERCSMPDAEDHARCAHDPDAADRHLFSDAADRRFIPDAADRHFVPDAADRHFIPDAADRRVAAYAALAVAIHVAESALPMPLPGVKLGLANVVTLVVLLREGPRAAAWVSGLRVLTASLLLGQLLAPAFWLSASGALASFVALLGLRRLPGISAIGLSLAAAQAHMLGQFTVAYALFVPHPGLWTLLPPMLTAALASGWLSGRIAQYVLDHAVLEPGHRPA